MLSSSTVPIWVAMPLKPNMWEEIIRFLHSVEVAPEHVLIVGGLAVLVVGGSCLMQRTSKEQDPTVVEIPQATAPTSAGKGHRLSSSVFAPPAVQPGAEFLVQVFAYLAEHEQRARTMACEFDELSHLHFNDPIGFLIQPAPPPRS